MRVWHFCKMLIVPALIILAIDGKVFPLALSDYGLIHCMFLWALGGGIVSHVLEKRPGWEDSRYLELWFTYFQRFFWPSPHPVLTAATKEKLPEPVEHALATGLLMTFTWVIGVWSLLTWSFVAPLLSRRQVDILVEVNQLDGDGT